MFSKKKIDFSINKSILKIWNKESQYTRESIYCPTPNKYIYKYTKTKHLDSETS